MFVVRYFECFVGISCKEFIIYREVCVLCGVILSLNRGGTRDTCPF